MIPQPPLIEKPSVSCHLALNRGDRVVLLLYSEFFMNTFSSRRPAMISSFVVATFDYIRECIDAGVDPTEGGPLIMIQHYRNAEGTDEYYIMGFGSTYAWVH